MSKKAILLLILFGFIFLILILQNLYKTKEVNYLDEDKYTYVLMKDVAFNNNVHNYFIVKLNLRNGFSESIAYLSNDFVEKKITNNYDSSLNSNSFKLCVGKSNNENYNMYFIKKNNGDYFYELRDKNQLTIKTLEIYDNWSLWKNKLITLKMQNVKGKRDMFKLMSFDLETGKEDEYINEIVSFLIFLNDGIICRVNNNLKKIVFTQKAFIDIPDFIKGGLTYISGSINEDWAYFVYRLRPKAKSILYFINLKDYRLFECNSKYRFCSLIKILSLNDLKELNIPADNHLKAFK